MKLIESLKEYQKLKKKIFNYFGCDDSAMSYDIEDFTPDYWMIIRGNDGVDSRVVTSSKPFTKQNIKQKANYIFESSVYFCIRPGKGYFLPKKNYTMMYIDYSWAESNDTIGIFSNDKEEKRQELKKLYIENFLTEFAAQLAEQEDISHTEAKT